MPGFCLWGHQVDDMLGKVGVEFAALVLDSIAVGMSTIRAVRAVGSHDGSVSLDCEMGLQICLRLRLGEFRDN